QDNQVTGYQVELEEREVDAINAYDNSILYSDYFVSEVINLLKNDAVESTRTITYFSDHGEEVFQNDNIKGHTPDNLTKNMLEIPFIVWSSDQNSSQIISLRKNINSAFKLDGFFSYALTMLNVSSSILITERSPATENFQAPTQRKIYKTSYENILRKN
ncbi:MAG: sulfatase-like hydrolase/transferase, partial [Oleibacter sp.]|nr:sulfatase-like hydrolase/transferase [Thalassolituus sp.]